MKRYLVKWVEYHEQEIEAPNDEDILLECEVNQESPTFQNASLQDIEDLGDAEPDFGDPAYREVEK